MSREAEAQHAHHVFHLWLLEHVGFDLFHHSAGTLLRGARGQLHIDQHGALVFVGQEGGGQTHINHRHGGDDGGVNHQIAACSGQQAGDAAFVAFGGAGKAPVEPAKETGLGVVVSGFHRFQQSSTQGRGER